MTLRRTRRSSFLTLAFVLAAAALIASGCSDDSDGDAADATSTTSSDSSVDLSDAEWVDRTDEADVVIQGRDNSFLPGYVVVKAGTPVTFRNVGRTAHNALPSDEAAFEPIQADDFQPQDEQTISLDEPGDYPYYCSLHGTPTNGMVGAIRVVE